MTYSNRHVGRAVGHHRNPIQSLRREGKSKVSSARCRCYRSRRAELNLKAALFPIDAITRGVGRRTDNGKTRKYGGPRCPLVLSRQIPI